MGSVGRVAFSTVVFLFFLLVLFAACAVHGRTWRGAGVILAIGSCARRARDGRLERMRQLAILLTGHFLYAGFWSGGRSFRR